MPKKLNLTGDAEADRLVSEVPFVLLSGTLLDQQISSESFANPSSSTPARSCSGRGGHSARSSRSAG
jgi:hypothetical protein